MPGGKWDEVPGPGGRCGLATQAEWREKGASAHIPGSSGLWKLLHLATRWCCRTKAQTVSRPFCIQPAWGEEGKKQASHHPLPWGLFSLADDESPGLYGFLHVIVHSAKGFKQSASKYP